MRLRRTGMIAGLMLVGPLAIGGCRFEKQISGQVTDFDSGEGLPGARVCTAQSGWGFRHGSLVWDKTHVTRTQTGPDGNFTLHYRVGDSARLAVYLDGYQYYQSWVAANSRTRARMKRLLPDAAALPHGFLRLGRRVDGSYYGWNFSRGEIAAAADADIIPDAVEASPRGGLRIRAAAQGGIRFVTGETLGVDDHFLVYTDSAPQDGYQDSVELDFESAGVVFVRTRDRRYAKVGLDPGAFFMESSPDIVRDLTLRYVYNPDGTRDLRFQETGQANWPGCNPVQDS